MENFLTNVSWVVKNSIFNQGDSGSTQSKVCILLVTNERRHK